MSEKEALLPTKRIFAINAPSKVRNRAVAYHQIICAVKSQTARLQRSKTLAKQ